MIKGLAAFFYLLILKKVITFIIRCRKVTIAFVGNLGIINSIVILQEINYVNFCKRVI